MDQQQQRAQAPPWPLILFPGAAADPGTTVSLSSAVPSASSLALTPASSRPTTPLLAPSSPLATPPTTPRSRTPRSFRSRRTDRDLRIAAFGRVPALDWPPVGEPTPPPNPLRALTPLAARLGGLTGAVPGDKGFFSFHAPLQSLADIPAILHVLAACPITQVSITLVAQDPGATQLLFDELTLPVGISYVDLSAMNLPRAAIPQFADFLRRSYASGVETILVPKAAFADRAALMAAVSGVIEAHPTLEHINLASAHVPTQRNLAAKAAARVEFRYLLDMARTLSHVRCDCKICTRAHALEFGRSHAKRLPPRAVRRILEFAAYRFTPAQVGRICDYAQNKAEWAVVAAALASHRDVGHREHAAAADEWIRNGGFFVRRGM
ncbi:uncharacterized protein LOC62_03G003932 [Vanrija pseudolonga]|uniref:Uncharacterized protein n=1 Tax=Vanrija pseudolonga TaxID=143232 RepID=A0AAF1BL55_9TREE|nr:hypothetical protein LOC62_03G003932 [Vanrija pseudolonga]